MNWSKESKQLIDKKFFKENSKTYFGVEQRSADGLDLVLFTYAILFRRNPKKSVFVFFFVVSSLNDGR